MNNQISDKQLNQLRLVIGAFFVITFLWGFFSSFMWILATLLGIFFVASFFVKIVTEGTACYCLRLGKLRPNALLPGMRVCIPVIDAVTTISTRNVLEVTSMVSINTLGDNFVMEIETLIKYKLRPEGVVRFSDTWTEKTLSTAIRTDAREIVRRIIGQHTHDEIGNNEDLRKGVLEQIKEAAVKQAMGYDKKDVDDDGNEITVHVPGKYIDVIDTYELVLQNPDFDPKWLALQGKLVETLKEQEISAQRLVVAQNELEITRKNAEGLRYALEQENAAYLDKAKKLVDLVGPEQAAKLLQKEQLQNLQTYVEGNTGNSNVLPTINVSPGSGNQGGNGGNQRGNGHHRQNNRGNGNNNSSGSNSN